MTHWETDILNIVGRFLRKADIEFNAQKKCGRYRIDLYLSEYRIAIEIDENGHRYRDILKERKRQRYIERVMGCKFLRFDPDDENFDVVDIMGEILVATRRPA